MIDDKGFVYLVANRSMPNMYKVGMTRVSVGERIRTLSSSSSVPTPFVELLSVPTGHALQLEKYIHRKLRPKRVSRSREFFLFPNHDAARDEFRRCLEGFEPREYTEKETKALSQRSGDTASAAAKKAGFKSLAQVSRMLGVNKNGHPMVSQQTLRNWHRDKPALFGIVIDGCVARLNRG